MTRAPTLSLEEVLPQPRTLESGVEDDIPRRVAKPSAEILALPLSHITTQAIGAAVVPAPGIPELYGEECMSMVMAMGGKLMLPSVETVDLAITNPKQEAFEMFAVAMLAKKIPRMNIVDAEGLILFPSAVYFPLPLATIVNMRAELVRSNLLQLGVSQQAVTDLRLVGSLREALK